MLAFFVGTFGLGAGLSEADANGGEFAGADATGHEERNDAVGAIAGEADVAFFLTGGIGVADDLDGELDAGRAGGVVELEDLLGGGVKCGFLTGDEVAGGKGEADALFFDAFADGFEAFEIGVDERGFVKAADADDVLDIAASAEDPLVAGAAGDFEDATVGGEGEACRERREDTCGASLDEGGVEGEILLPARFDEKALGLAEEDIIGREGADVGIDAADDGPFVVAERPTAPAVKLGVGDGHAGGGVDAVNVGVEAELLIAWDPPPEVSREGDGDEEEERDEAGAEPEAKALGEGEFVARGRVGGGGAGAGLEQFVQENTGRCEWAGIACETVKVRREIGVDAFDDFFDAGAVGGSGRAADGDGDERAAALLKDDVGIAHADVVEALLVAFEGLFDEVADGGEHARDGVGILYVLQARGGGVEEEEAGLAVDEEGLLGNKVERFEHHQFGVGNAGAPGTEAALGAVDGEGIGNGGVEAEEEALERVGDGFADGGAHHWRYGIDDVAGVFADGVAEGLLDGGREGAGELLVFAHPQGDGLGDDFGDEVHLPALVFGFAFEAGGFVF